MRIEFTKAAIKALKRIDEPLRSRVLMAIQGLTETPPKGDIKPMQGNPAGRYRLRVGGYRVIYAYRQDGAMCILCILDIGSRGDIYK